VKMPKAFGISKLFGFLTAHGTSGAFFASSSFIASYPQHHEKN
jgi:hypothetical protein